MALRVLLLTPRFYGIEKKIKSALEESDYEVTWIENKTLALDYHGRNSKFKLLRRWYYLFASPHKRYLKQEFKKIKNPAFDILFSINAHVICPYLLRKLKNANRNIISVLYLWDSFSMYNWENEIKLFNKVFTFDHNDAIEFQIDYKPIFFIKRDTPVDTENDLLFVGKFSKDRLEVIDKIFSISGIDNLKFYVKLWPAYRIFLHSHLLYRVFKTIKIRNSWIDNYLLNFEVNEGKLKRKYLVTESINCDEVQNQMLRSNVILDIPFRFQRGYTHRIIEALANGKKVITINQEITKEDFYNPEQIHLLDRDNPQIDMAWINRKSGFPVSRYFSEVELSQWLKSIINAGFAESKS